MGRLARDFPQLLNNAEVISTMLAQGGLRLHPETALQIATAQVAPRYTGKPELKITDHGLVDVASFELVPLGIE